MSNNLFREQVAGAARSLWMNYRWAGTTPDSLRHAPGASIVHTEAICKMGRGYIHPVAFAVMRSQRRAQAPFAERLYVTEGVSAEELREMRLDEMRLRCKKLDAREPDRTYTLEDMRQAYALAWEASGEGYNGEIQPNPSAMDSWLKERDEALGKIERAE